MAINQATDTSVNTFNLRYSAFLGMIYVSTPESEAAIKAVKAEVGGEAEVKKGYQGNSGNSASAKAIALLKTKGVTPVSIDGRLSSTRVIERDIEGRKTPYLNVRLRDADGIYNLSVSLAQRGAQMLVRKLANAEPAADTVLKLFGTYAAKPGADRAYAEHGCSLKQSGNEVAGVSPKDALAPRVTAAIEALKAAGVADDDKETLNKRRAKVELDYHNELMTAVTAKFTDFYATRELPVDELEAAPEDQHIGSYADMDDDIPF